MNERPPHPETTSSKVADDPLPPRLRLNLFALPSLTTLLFALIVGVILIAVVAGLRQNPSALGFLIAIGMLILPVRDFLRRVDTRVRSLNEKPSLEAPSPLAWLGEVDQVAGELHVKKPPELLLAPEDLAPTTIGSWRRHYVALGRPQAQHLTRLPRSTRRVLWLHEVGHFANGDQWKVGLAGSLLGTSITFMTWSAFFLLGIVILARVYGLELFEPGFLDSLPLEPAQRSVLARIWPDSAAMAPLLDQARQVDLSLAALYVLDAHLPFVFSGIVLLVFIWRSLVQVREYYADARVADRLGNLAETRQSLSLVAWQLEVANQVEAGRGQSWKESVRLLINRVAPFHPSWDDRYACLLDPTRAFGSAKRAGLVAGLAVLLLDVILVGPFTLGYVSAGPAHFATLTGFIVLALWLLPGVCRGFDSPSKMLHAVGQASLVFAAVRAGWLLLNTALALALLVLSPQLLQELLNAVVYLGNKVLVLPPAPVLDQDPATLVLSSVGGAWILMALILLCLFLGLRLVGALFQRLLTWYAFPRAQRRLIPICGGVILLIALVLGAIVLPLPTAVIQSDIASLEQPAAVVVGGLAFLLAVGAAVWFVHTDRRYARRCPNPSCGAAVPGSYYVGKRCPRCGALLQPWLVANY